MWTKYTRRIIGAYALIGYYDKAVSVYININTKLMFFSFNLLRLSLSNFFNRIKTWNWSKIKIYRLAIYYSFNLRLIRVSLFFFYKKNVIVTLYVCQESIGNLKLFVYIRPRSKLRSSLIFLNKISQKVKPLRSK